MKKQNIFTALQTLNTISKNIKENKIKTAEQIDEAMFGLYDAHVEINKEETFFYYDSEIVDSRWYVDDESAAESLGIDAADFVEGFYIEDWTRGTFSLVDEKDVENITYRLRVDAWDKLFGKSGALNALTKGERDIIDTVGFILCNIDAEDFDSVFDIIASRDYEFELTYAKDEIAFLEDSFVIIENALYDASRLYGINSLLNEDDVVSLHHLVTIARVQIAHDLIAELCRVIKSQIKRGDVEKMTLNETIEYLQALINFY